MQTNSQTAQQAMNDALDSYIIDSGVAQGLISNNAVVQAVPAALKAYFKEVATIDEIMALQSSEEAGMVYIGLMDSLRHKLWTGDTKLVKIDDGNGNIITVEKPNTTSPATGFGFKDSVFSAVQKGLIENWTPKTPTLTHKPNARRFLEICRDFFPNVKYPYKAANGLRAMFENIHASCGTDGAKHTQTALWLYELRVGGGGKSWFLDRLGEALRGLSVDAADVTLQPDSQWMNPAIGMHTVSIVGETPKFDANLAPVINNIIDNKFFPYNIKYGAHGDVKSVATVVFASNFEPFETNTRRYAMVEYLQRDVNKGVTDEERKLYFPLWGLESVAVAEIQEALAVCPFACEHPLDFLPEHGRVDDIGTKNDDILMQIKTLVEDKEDSQYIDFTKMRPTEMAERIAKKYGQRYEITRAKTVNLLSELKIRDKLPVKACRGRTPLEYKRYDWRKIAALVEDNAEDESADDFETIRADWNELIDME